jgi:hypothetical protein
VKSVEDKDLMVDWSKSKHMRRKFETRPRKSDDEIKQALKEVFLYDSRLSPFNLTVAVENGVVTLTGIGPHSSPRPDADAELARKVRLALLRNPYTHQHEITVTVNNYLVMLDGEEGTTGKFDNKGAIFIPGGLVYQDADEQNVRYESLSGMSGSEFRSRIRSAMRFDNAILLYPDGLAPGINLDNGFFSKAARQILNYKKAAYRRKKNISKHIANEVSSDDIIRSNCPPYMKPPYGARTRISTCISVGLVDPLVELDAVDDLNSVRGKVNVLGSQII